MEYNLDDLGILYYEHKEEEFERIVRTTQVVMIFFAASLSTIVVWLFCR